MYTLVIAGLCVFVEQPGPVDGILGESLDIPCVTSSDFQYAWWYTIDADGTETNIWLPGDGFGDYADRYELIGTGNKNLTLRIGNVTLDQPQLKCEVYIDPTGTEKSTPSDITVVGKLSQ